MGGSRCCRAGSLRANWRVIDEDLWQTVGASVARDGERTTRVFRDMAVAAAHRNLQLRETFYGDIGRAALGEPQRAYKH